MITISLMSQISFLIEPDLHISTSTKVKIHTMLTAEKQSFAFSNHTNIHKHPTHNTTFISFFTKVFSSQSSKINHTVTLIATIETSTHESVNNPWQSPSHFSNFQRRNYMYHTSEEQISPSSESVSSSLGSLTLGSVDSSCRGSAVRAMRA